MKYYLFVTKKGVIHEGFESENPQKSIDSFLSSDRKIYFNRIYWGFSDSTETKQEEVILYVEEERICPTKEAELYLQLCVKNKAISALLTLL